MTAQQLGMAFYGLQGMKSDVLEVQELVPLLLARAEEVVLDSQGLANVVFGKFC